MDSPNTISEQRLCLFLNSMKFGNLLAVVLYANELLEEPNRVESFSKIIEASLDFVAVSEWTS